MLIRAAYAGFKRRSAYRNAVASLEALDDHILKDIGISRSGIYPVARATARNPRLDIRYFWHG